LSAGVLACQDYNVLRSELRTIVAKVAVGRWPSTTPGCSAISDAIRIELERNAFSSSSVVVWNHAHGDFERGLGLLRAVIEYVCGGCEGRKSAIDGEAKQVLAAEGCKK
jgi:hypothetical protein